MMTDSNLSFDCDYDCDLCHGCGCCGAEDWLDGSRKQDAAAATTTSCSTRWRDFSSCPRHWWKLLEHSLYDTSEQHTDGHSAVDESLYCEGVRAWTPLHLDLVVHWSADAEAPAAG